MLLNSSVSGHRQLNPIINHVDGSQMSNIPYSQESYWTKAPRPIYPDLDCRCGAESTSFKEDEP